MKSCGLLAEEVPSRIVRRGSLGHLAVRAGLDGVDQVGEMNGRLDEEDGDVVAHNVEVALVGITTLVLVCCSSVGERLGYLQSRRKAVDITHRISTAPGASNGREADEDGRLLSLLAQERSSSDVAIVSIAGESAVGSSTTSMDSPFGDLYTQRVSDKRPNLKALQAYEPARGRNE